MVQNHHSKDQCTALWPWAVTWTPKIKMTPWGHRASQEEQGWTSSKPTSGQHYSLHQLLFCGRIFEASEFLASFDLIELRLEDRLLILPELFLPLHFFLLLEKPALFPDLCDPVFFIIWTLRTFCITWFSFWFFLLFLKIKIVRSSSFPSAKNIDPLFPFK